MWRKAFEALGKLIGSSNSCLTLLPGAAAPLVPSSIAAPIGTLYDLKKQHLQELVSKKPDAPQIHAPPAGRINVAVELPNGCIDRPGRLFQVPSDVTANELVKLLAIHYNVAEHRWNLYGSINREKYPASLLASDALIDVYGIHIHPDSRLYFYPKMHL